MSSEQTFLLDGKEIPFQEGDTIMDAALRAGAYIPHLCHNPEFTPHGSCRVCVVDIDGRNVSACTQPAAAVERHHAFLAEGEGVDLELGHVGHCLDDGRLEVLLVEDHERVTGLDARTLAGEHARDAPLARCGGLENLG